MKYRPKHIFEYLLMRLCIGLLKLMPLRLALATGWLIALPMHFVFGWRREEARRRIRSVFGETLPEREVRHIAWRSFRNLVFTAVEMVRITPRRIRRYSRQPGLQPFRDLVAQREKNGDTSGAIIATIHMGNWELSALAGCECGLPGFFVARRQKNPLTDNYLNKIIRGASGAETIHNDPHLLRQVIRNLKTGKMLGILPDVRARTPALDIEFLGGRANLGAGMAMFARQANVPVYPIHQLREGWTHHRVIIGEPLYCDPALDKKEDWARMTAAIMKHYDRIIREHPEHYFWYNKRWVLDPL